MGRKLLAVIISCMIIMLSLPVGSASAKTISNPDKIKVGLKSVQSSSLSVTIEGHFKVNGTPMLDKNLKFNIKNGKIEFNSSLYEEIYLEPVVASSRVAIVSSGKTNRYSGVIQLKVVSNTILPVNYIDMQSYLKGVLPYEISNSYPIESIKSQAITSRTFALSNLNKHKSEGINVCDTTNCQVYKGENPSYKNIANAVDQTKNMVLTYNGLLASVTFGASNGGYTESSLNIWGSNNSYLPVIQDKYDENPWPESKVYTTVEIDKLLKDKSHISSGDKFLKIGEIVKNSSSRVSEMEIIYLDNNGKQNTKILKKEEPRWAFSLRSMLFDVNYNTGDDSYTFNGSGYGHGVGMSQLGAKARAQDGQKNKEILGFYFPGTKIEALSVTEGEKPSLPPLNPGTTEPEKPNKPDVPSKPISPQDKVVAKIGTRGSVVKTLQGDLNYLGYSTGTAD
ncbi:MAG: SpoIID/LytB domain-containing protein, partial [Clostridium sp.]